MNAFHNTEYNFRIVFFEFIGGQKIFSGSLDKDNISASLIIIIATPFIIVELIRENATDYPQLNCSLPKFELGGSIDTNYSVSGTE